MVATIPPKKVTNSDVGDADHVGGDDWDLLSDWVGLGLKTHPYKYTVYQDGSDTKCFNHDTGAVVSTNTNDVVVLQYAVDNAAGRPIQIKAGTYVLTAELNCNNKSVWIVGEQNAGGSSAKLQKAGSGNILNISHTDGTTMRDRTHLENFEIDGVDKLGTGLRTNSVIGCFNFVKNIKIVNCLNGWWFTNGWYDNIWSLWIENCATGLWIENNSQAGTMQDGGNTLYFYGGKIQGCTTYNLYVDVLNEQMAFYGMVLEDDATHNATNVVRIDSEAELACFYDCSFENFNDGAIIVHDAGKNTRLVNCRFQTFGSSETQTAYEAVGARSSSLIGNQFGASSTGTFNITIDSASSDISLVNNQRRRWINPLATILTDNSATTTRIGNSFCADKIRRYSSLDFQAEFIGTAALGGSPFTATAVATGTVAGPNSGLVNANHVGVIKLLSSTTTNSGINLTMSSTGMLLGGGECFEAIFNITTLTDLTLRMGFGDTGTSSDCTDGAYIEIASTGVAVGKTANSGTKTTSSTIHTLSTATWYHAWIKVNQDATAVDFYILNESGSLVGTPRQNTANIPTGAGESAVRNSATNAGTTAVDLVHVDYLHVWSDRVLARG